MANPKFNESHIIHLNALENSRFQESFIKHPNSLKLVDDIIYFLSHEFIDTTTDRNNFFKVFFTQISVDLNLAVLSILRRHDIQACLMLRHALESICLAAYAISFCEPITSESEFVNNFKDTKKAYIRIEKEFPKRSESIKKIKEKINENFSHANIKTSAANLTEKDGEMNPCFFDSNNNETLPKRFFVVSEVAYLALDLLEMKIKKSDSGIVLNKGVDGRIRDFAKQIDKVFANFIK